MNKNSIKKIKNKASLHKRQEIITLTQLSHLLMNFWSGGIIMTTIIILPLLFNELDLVTASSITSQILLIQYFIGLVIIIFRTINSILVEPSSILKRHVLVILLVMFIIILIYLFHSLVRHSHLSKQVLHYANQIISLQSSAFDFIHSYSAIILIVLCFLNIIYLFKNRFKL